MEKVLCACGCGQETRLSPVTITRKGKLIVRRGEPNRYLYAHNRQNIPYVNGYRRTPMNSNAFLHRTLAEKALGGPLPPKVVVHHADKDRGSMRPSLVICEDHAYHMLLHRRMRVKRAGGDPNTDKVCTKCRRPKPRSEFTANAHRADGLADYCRPCDRAEKARYYKSKHPTHVPS